VVVLLGDKLRAGVTVFVPWASGSPLGLRSSFRGIRRVPDAQQRIDCEESERTLDVCILGAQYLDRAGAPMAKHISFAPSALSVVRDFETGGILI
jgi:hypothetical protein